MRKLDRPSVAAPRCLSRFSPGKHGWAAVGATEKQEIRCSLEALQGARCAYCEADLSKEGQHPHIEHFVQRSFDVKGTFEWSNLFWSCSARDQCGKYKDQGAGHYQRALVLKPDVDDGRRFLRFFDDGSVDPRSGLTQDDLGRARETIRVFALNCQRLRAARRPYLAAPRKQRAEAISLFSVDAELLDYLDDLATDYEKSAYSSAIRDVLVG